MRPITAVRIQLGLLAVTGGTALLLLTGCAGAPSTLNPAGYGARRVAGLWWILFWISVAVFAVVVALLAWGLARRRRTGVRVSVGEATRFVVIAGFVLPLIILAVVYAIGLDRQASLADQPSKDAMTIDVIGHQWWWEVRYPRTGAVTANEIHIPVGLRVQVKLTTADVLHSFWVPQLSVKTDMIKGKVNDAWLLAEKAGRYRGQCAEYCGLQHARMAFLVVAQPQADFDAWLGRLTHPSPPTGAAARRGLLVFERGACASCHTIAGTTAHGDVGPNLTNIGSRWSLGAGTVANTPGHLGGWIANSQTIKPGNQMPPQPLAPADLRDLITYLESMK